MIGFPNIYINWPQCWQRWWAGELSILANRNRTCPEQHPNVDQVPAIPREIDHKFVSSLYPKCRQWCPLVQSPMVCLVKPHICYMFVVFCFSNVHVFLASIEPLLFCGFWLPLTTFLINLMLKSRRWTLIAHFGLLKTLVSGQIMFSLFSCWWGAQTCSCLLLEPSYTFCSLLFVLDKSNVVPTSADES